MEKPSKSTDIDAREARRLVGKALFGADWIGSLSKKELDLLSGPQGPRRKRLASGRTINLIPPCSTATLRKRLDLAIGRAERAVLQDATVIDVMHDNGFHDVAEAFDRGRVDRFLKKLGTGHAELPPRRVGKRPVLIGGIIAKMASDTRAGIDIESMIGKELADRYGASRGTCEKARTELRERLARK